MAKKTESPAPTSFRLSDDAKDALEAGAARFRMNQTQWLEFLLLSAVANKKVTIQYPDADIAIESNIK